MAASLMACLLILGLVCLVVVIVPQTSGVGTFFGIGSLIGIVSVPLVVGVMLFCSKGFRNIITRKDGLEISNEGYTNPMPELASLANNTYQQSPAKSNEKQTPASTNCPCHSTPHASLQRKFSACSDYTESHYYTEIDEYFINKRKAKQEQKFQKRFEDPGVHHVPPTSGNPIDNSCNVYDYAYGRIPPK